MINSTVGQILVNEALPADLRRYDRVLDKKGVAQLFEEVASKHPDKYRDIAQRMMMLGQYNSQAASASVSLSAMLPPPEIEQKLVKLRAIARQIGESNMPEKERNKKLVDAIQAESDNVRNGLYDAGTKAENPLALQAKSGSRGNASQLMQIVAGDMLVGDHKNRLVPVPILHGYAHSLEPVEYWAAAYGARKGSVSTKFATQEAGAFGKQMAMAAHRLVVTEKDCGAKTGIGVTANDTDNIGAVLALDAGPYKAGTVIDGRMIKELGDSKIVLRSPSTCQADHGICQRCVGHREKGGFPPIGDNVGIAAAQSISERLSQGQLSAKHSGGLLGQEKATSGFDYIDSLAQVPKTFRDAAAIASVDGMVDKIEAAPQGGSYIWIGGEKHYSLPDIAIKVKTGQRVEAGDVISEGTPNPATIVEHKGIGEGRRHFIGAFYDAFVSAGIRPHRRNIELMARGLINHVQVNDLDGVSNTLPDDIIGYDTLARDWQPREGSENLHPSRAIGMHLEQPALHYSIGTRITPSVSKELADAKIDKITAHKNPPPFHPVMIRAMESGFRDMNPITRLGGSYLERGMLESVHRGRTSEIHDTSYIPSLAEGKNLGLTLTQTGKY